VNPLARGRAAAPPPPPAAPGPRPRRFALASVPADPHQGFVHFCDIVQNTPKAWRQKAAKLVAMKCALLARSDAYGQDPAGETGRQMKAEVLAKIDKWQEPPPAKQIKPLPRPDQEAKKKRGGKRHRKMKERYGMTDIEKLANRVKFGEAEDEVLDGDEMVGVGMLGKEGSGRIRCAGAPAPRDGVGGGGKGAAGKPAPRPWPHAPRSTPHTPRPTPCNRCPTPHRAQGHGGTDEEGQSPQGGAEEAREDVGWEARNGIQVGNRDVPGLHACAGY